MFKWILEYIPDHQTYCEPFGGAASVLMNKERSQVEVYNDLEPSIVNLLRIVRDDADQLLSVLREVEYCKEVYLEHRDLYLSEAYHELSDMDKAVSAYIARRMSRGGVCGTFSWSKRIYSTGPAEVHCWNSALQNFEHVSQRLQGVEILNEDASEIMKKYDGPDTVFYLDPPYLHSTRVSTNIYAHEMSEEEHRLLAVLCRRLEGAVVLSGYPSELYCELYEGWQKVSKDTANHSSHKGSKDRMQECLWIKKPRL